MKEADTSSGAIQQEMDIILQGASGGIIQLLAMIDTLFNRLSEFGTLTFIEKVTGQLSTFLTWLTRTDEEGELVHGRLLMLINAGLFLAASMLGVALALRVVAFSLAPLIFLFKALIVTWAFLRSGTILLRIQLFYLAFEARALAVAAWFVTWATKAWTAAQWLLNVAMAANPLGAMIVGALALAAVGYYVYRNWDKVRSLFMSFSKGGFSGWFSRLGLLPTIPGSDDEEDGPSDEEDGPGPPFPRR